MHITTHELISKEAMEHADREFMQWLRSRPRNERARLAERLRPGRRHRSADPRLQR